MQLFILTVLVYIFEWQRRAHSVTWNNLFAKHLYAYQYRITCVGRNQNCAGDTAYTQWIYVHVSGSGHWTWGVWVCTPAPGALQSWMSPLAPYSAADSTSSMTWSYSRKYDKHVRDHSKHFSVNGLPLPALDMPALWDVEASSQGAYVALKVQLIIFEIQLVEKHPWYIMWYIPAVIKG